jgi:hypothetical protein
MKYWLIESKFITNKLLNVKGIVLFPFVFVDNKNNKRLVNHELIHIEQIKDCGFLKFYLIYLYKWYKVGYLRIPFEIEAYNNDFNYNYIKKRKRKEWTF